MSKKPTIGDFSIRKAIDDQREDSQGALIETRQIDPRLQERPAREGQLVERIPITKIVPDQFQARRVIPSEIANRFFAGEIDCLQAAMDWLNLVESDEEAKLRLQTLRPLAESIRLDGQINSIKGAWQMDRDSRSVFMLESGERRFWAVALNWAMDSGTGETPKIKAESVVHVDRFRQINENLKTSQYTVIGRACAFAEAILFLMKMQPQNDLTTFEYCRQVQKLRVHAAIWEEIQSRLSISRSTIYEYLQIFVFSDEFLNIADQYDVPLYVLLDIRSQPEENWFALLTDWISKNAAQDADGTGLPSSKNDGPILTREHPKDPAEKFAKRLRVAIFGKGLANPAIDAEQLAAATFAEIGDDPVKIHRTLQYMDKFRELLESEYARFQKSKRG